MKDERFDAEGFLQDPALWSRDLAQQIATDLGIGELRQSHWTVIGFLREHYLTTTGSLPWEGNPCRELDLVDDWVQRLFGGPLRAWKVAGLPDPGKEASRHMRELMPPRGRANAP
jgi:sulfur relay (sulfurtransferase) DsrC/TusE family protein